MISVTLNTGLYGVEGCQNCVSTALVWLHNIWLSYIFKVSKLTDGGATISFLFLLPINLVLCRGEFCLSTRCQALTNGGDIILGTRQEPSGSSSAASCQDTREAVVEEEKRGKAREK